MLFPTVETCTILKLLLDCGANPNEIPPQGTHIAPTPLICAIASQARNTANISLEAVKALLNAGASVDLQGAWFGELGAPINHAGKAIMLSETIEACTILKLLVQHGADPNAIPPSGKTDALPLAHVLTIMNPQHSTYLPELQPELRETVDLLLSKGANPSLLPEEYQVFLTELRSMGHLKN
jgi:hypothetical protein